MFQPRHYLIAALCAAGWFIPAGADEQAAPPGARSLAVPDEPQKQLFTGKVVLLEDALKQRGIEFFDEMKGQAVLETPEGELIPFVADWRGRAFFQDKRLRDRRVELVGYRRPGVPYLQVLIIFTFDEKGIRQYTDYWCDICSIPMYQIKPCDCCQGPIELRFQPQELPAYLKNGIPREDSPAREAGREPAK